MWLQVRPLSLFTAVHGTLMRKLLFSLILPSFSMQVGRIMYSWCLKFNWSTIEGQIKCHVHLTCPWQCVNQLFLHWQSQCSFICSVCVREGKKRDTNYTGRVAARLKVCGNELTLFLSLSFTFSPALSSCILSKCPLDYKRFLASRHHRRRSISLLEGTMDSIHSLARLQSYCISLDHFDESIILTDQSSDDYFSPARCTHTHRVTYTRNGFCVRCSNFCHRWSNRQFTGQMVVRINCTKWHKLYWSLDSFSWRQ